MNSKGMFYTNVSDYETKEDMMNDFIALRMYDMAKDKEIERLKKQLNDEIDDELKQSEIMVKKQEEIERLNNIIKGLDNTIENLEEVIERKDSIINRTTKYVQSLSSKGRGCDIYEDIKQEILKKLKGSDKE